MTEVIKYVLLVVAAVVVFRFATAVLGAVFGSFTGLVILAIVGYLIWRILGRGRMG